VSDEFSPLERGMNNLLAHAVDIASSHLDSLLLLEQRLNRNIAEARTYGPDPTQKSELNRIIYTLNSLSLQITGKSFNEWCKWHPPDQQSTSSEEIQHIEQYIGRLESVSTGSVHQELMDQLTEMGAKPKGGQKELQEDMLERYATVSLHAIFLYTSQDEVIAPYILNHWGALDSLSGDICDIHPVVDQFNNIEDAYDYIKRLSVVKDANFVSLSKLPGLFFWDHEGTTEYIFFGSKTNSSDITYILRLIFEKLLHEPVIASITHAKSLLDQKVDSIVDDDQIRRE